MLERVFGDERDELSKIPKSAMVAKQVLQGAILDSFKSLRSLFLLTKLIVN